MDTHNKQAMANYIKIFLYTALCAGIVYANGIASAQSLPEPRAVCAYCGTPVPNGVHSSNCPYHTKTGSKGSRPSSAKTDINAMVTGAILNSMLTSLLTPAKPAGSSNQQEVLAAQLKASELAARQMVEYQKARDAAFLAEHMKTKQSFRSLDGSQGLAFKGLTDSTLAFKSPDEGLEDLAAESRKPFDTSAEIKTPAPDVAAEATPFFGDPKMQKYFSADAPELNFLLDISKLAAANNMFGKWIIKKLPIIGAIEISVKQSYNALDWLLSFNRIADANKVNGKVMDAAKKIQRNIDQTRQALKECPRS